MNNLKDLKNIYKFLKKFQSLSKKEQNIILKNFENFLVYKEVKKRDK